MTLTRPHLVDGQIVHLPLTTEELAQREADEAAALARSDITPEQNGAALDERQKQTAKEDARALLMAGKTDDAVLKLMELL